MYFISNNAVKFYSRIVNVKDNSGNLKKKKPKYESFESLIEFWAEMGSRNVISLLLITLTLNS